METVQTTHHSKEYTSEMYYGEEEDSTCNIQDNAEGSIHIADEVLSLPSGLLWNG